MRQIAKTILLVAGANFIPFVLGWAFFSSHLPILHRSDYETSLTLWQDFSTYLLIVLGAPATWFLNPETPLVFFVQQLANSLLWGICLGYPIYAFRQKRQPLRLA